MEADQREQSEFNMAIFTLGRINYSLFLCSEHMRNMDLSAAFFEMQNTYMEVSTEMKGDSTNIISAGKKKDGKKHKINEFEMMEEFITDIEKLVEEYNSKTIKRRGLNKELYTKLRLMNMLLRRIMKASGLLLKMKEDASFALGH